MMLGSLWQGDTVISIALSGEVYYLAPDFPDKPKRVVHGHNKFITALAYDSANKHIYSGSYDASIVQWDVASGNTQTMVGKGHGNQINSMHVQGGNLITCYG
jgi:WD40 repeat protein